MSKYTTGQEIQYRSDWEFVNWVRGRILEAVYGYGRNPRISYYRIIPQNMRGVSIREITYDGTGIAIASPDEIRPVSPLILLAECAGDEVDYDVEA